MNAAADAPAPSAPEGLTPPDEHPPPRRETRKRMGLWDRVRLLLLLAVAWFVIVWAAMADNPLLPFVDSARIHLVESQWLLWLAGAEALRQLHFLVSERSSRYHRFWAHTVFGGTDRALRRRFSDWTRFRLARLLKWVAFVVLFALVAAQILETSPPLALFEAPALLFSALPFVFQLAFGFFFVAFQFIGLFWLLSRGGVDTYYPDDITTRFSDVWGQDHVVQRIRENILFLEDPEEIERKGGYVPGGMLLWGPPGTGKGEPVTSMVMTPSGPRAMGSLLPGDHVIGSDGRPTLVREVHLLGVRDIYRVHFSDGTSLRVTEDHLWQVSSRYGGTKVLSVSDLMGRLHEADGRARYRIPMVEPVQFEARNLPLDPYLMGALLGDGTFRHHIGFSTADPEILDRVTQSLPDGDGVVRKNEYDHSVVGGRTRTVLKELGLFGCYSHEKWIPEDYLWSTEEDRLALLRGLMDTDGTIDKRGVVEFHSTSERLAQGVRSLVQSFGGTCSITRRVTRYTHGGQRRRGKPVVIVRAALPPELVPVTVPRKVERYRPRTSYLPQRRIVDITPDTRAEARCLRVDAEDHLYVSENYIVTHNTLMAEAVAGETGKPYVFVDPGAFINMFMGVGILKVKSLFRKLRKLSLRYGGVIVFFDEADSLGNRGSLANVGPGGVRGFGPFHAAGCHGPTYLSDHTRWMLARNALVPAEADEGRNKIMMGMGGGGGGGMGTLQALLTELSGLKKPRGLVNRWGRRALGMRPKPPPQYRLLVMMATNMPESLDEALLRPGRIDRIYKVGYPSKAGRIRTYQGYFAKVPNAMTDEDLDKLATITPYATGATIKDLVNESLITAIRDGREVIEWRDVLKAKQLKDLGPPEDVEYIERERHAVAVHEACHAVVAYRTRRHMEIDLATIEKGSDYLGMVASIPPEDQFTRWRSEFESDILVSLASLAGERMFFDGDSSSGVSGDLESATTLATFMEGNWGMGATVSSYATARRLGTGAPGGSGGEPEGIEVLGRMRLVDRVEESLGALLERAVDILHDNRSAVLAVAHALETHKTLSGDDIEAVIDGRQGTTVDGSVYTDPAFLAELEEYHSAAAGAHQQHGAVMIMLPPGGHVVRPAAEAAAVPHEDPR